MNSFCELKVIFLMSSYNGLVAWLVDWGVVLDMGLSGGNGKDNSWSDLCLSSLLLSVSVWKSLPVGVLKCALQECTTASHSLALIPSASLAMPSMLEEV